jgi:hypothetical protein
MPLWRETYFQVKISSLPFPGWGQRGPFCREPAFLSTKWPLDQVASLQAGMAIDPGHFMAYKMVVPVNYLGPFESTTRLTLNFNPMIIKHDQTCTFMLLWKLQNKGPFCRASTSPGTQLKLPFSRCHFGEQNPVNRMATWFLLVNGELTVSLKNKRCSDKPLQDSFVSYRVVGFGCQTWFSVC